MLNIGSDEMNSKVPNTEETESIPIDQSVQVKPATAGMSGYGLSKAQLEQQAKNEALYGTKVAPSIILPSTYKPMDDDGFSQKEYAKDISDKSTFDLENNLSDYFTPTLHANGLFKRDEIDYFNNRYRFGIMNPYHQITNAREYLFFTKPDLNIYPRGINGRPDSQLAAYLRRQSEWQMMAQDHYEVLKCLQGSLDPENPFNNLLGNMVSSNLEVPGLSTDITETANSMYGVNLQYHGSAEASNDNFDFSLEFKDTKLLDVYTYFKAYELYHELSHHGVIEPWVKYSWFHILYDQYSIYKFIVDEDGETIIYWGKAYGVFSKSLPRDVFTNTNFDDGISYTVDFHAFQYRDMEPKILKEFNNLGRSYYESRKYRIDIFNEVFDRVDNRPAQAAAVEEEWHPIYNRNVPKLRWRGDAKY